ncbi:acetylornithine deacetylase [Sphingomonas colocasiae]|uniref:Acetylornithine deacetylase n=1 Tax=Sphingomonas colocasiae TaxID=1848973 RepID=A0ABS7PQR8_9SPHN|nr:acetylornithine deacetylase [Sphingomonas colocasiae]MBY8822359.1 acetylornithine deacetylase [Sphingomonas colocasiae]
MIESEAIGLLKTLVAFPTVSSEGNLDLIRWIADYLDRHDVKSRLSFDETGRKANLFATITHGQDAIILSGHTDVVPVAGQCWSSDPFVLAERDGRLHGRGTCDMKGFIAVALALVPRIIETPGRGVHLAFSYDEEIGCLGVRRLLDDMPVDRTSLAGCVIGEPTNMRAIIGHKGAGMYAFTVRGLAAHSSLAPHGVNAIHYASRVIGHLGAIARDLEQNETRHQGYDVPFSTIQVNRITGGTVGNIVADRCEFVVDIRSLPHTSHRQLLDAIEDFIDTQLLPEMRMIFPDASIDWRQVGDVPGFAIDEDSRFVRDVKRALRSNAPGGHVAFGTEAGLFERSGIPTLVCGPGSIEQAHKPDEFVAIEQLERCEQMLSALLLRH